MSRPGRYGRAWRRFPFIRLGRWCRPCWACWSACGWRSEDRRNGAAPLRVLALFLLLSVLVMVVQVRGARLAAVLAVPVGAALIAQLRGHYLGSGSRGALVGLVLGWVGFSGVIAGFAGGALVPPQPDNPAMAGIAGQAARRPAPCLRPFQRWPRGRAST